MRSGVFGREKLAIREKLLSLPVGILEISNGEKGVLVVAEAIRAESCWGNWTLGALLHILRNSVTATSVVKGPLALVCRRLSHHTVQHLLTL